MEPILARAVVEKNFGLIQEEAIRQVEEGAQVLDVNVGVTGTDEPTALRDAVKAIRDVTDVLLCTESAIPRALEAGLAACDGKALVNSVNGKKEKIERVLPIVKDIGAAAGGLTMDDEGILHRRPPGLGYERSGPDCGHADGDGRILHEFHFGLP